MSYHTHASFLVLNKLLTSLHSCCLVGSCGLCVLLCISSLLGVGVYPLVYISISRSRSISSLLGGGLGLWQSPESTGCLYQLVAGAGVLRHICGVGKNKACTQDEIHDFAEKQFAVFVFVHIYIDISSKLHSTFTLWGERFEGRVIIF